MLRYAAQQAAKSVPVLGWAVSAGLAAASTWGLGQAAALYFENGKRVRPPRPRRSLHAARQGVGRRLRALGRRVRAFLGAAARRVRRLPRREHPVVIEAIVKRET